MTRHKSPRQRSHTSVSTASNKRPKSRASTTSIRSTSLQPSYPYPQPSESAFQIQPERHGAPVRYTPEEMVSRVSHQLKNPDDHYAIDPSLQSQNHHRLPYNPANNLENQMNVLRPELSHQNSFDGKENQGFENTTEDLGFDESAAGDGGKKKKGSASTQANDQELKRLFRENQGRSLKDVAVQVLDNEQGPKAEKTKQIFAMLWLSSVCKRSNTSVPRNRVFSCYATRCGTERVPPLNPASFGKLVRIIFPNIQTRRLGVRGESKYHYVELSLVEDQQDSYDSRRCQSARVMGHTTSDSQSQRPQVPADTAIFPAPGSPVAPHFPSMSLRDLVPSSGTFLNSGAREHIENPAGPNMSQRYLKFSAREEESNQDNEPISLPSIDHYLPASTDPDTADALSALYRSHCVSVIDCFRYCKEKMFWHHFSSFHGTLTVPVQKLLAHPKIANWILECDWLMYQKMIGFAAPLVHRKPPARVFETFKAISMKLPSYISMTFQNQPQHVRDARRGPASIFANLIRRMLRVNEAGVAAQHTLQVDSNRDQMYQDWVQFVEPFNVIESSIPMCGFMRTVPILICEIREVLSPLGTSPYLGAGTAYEDWNPDFSSTSYQHQQPNPSGVTTGVLDRWVEFIHSIPPRYPEFDGRLLLSCMTEVFSAALRDLTVASAPSFGCWWITKVWFDEYILWLAEKGGFLEYGPSNMTMRSEVVQQRFATPFEGAYNFDEPSENYGESRPATSGDVEPCNEDNRATGVEANIAFQHGGDSNQFGRVDTGNGFDQDATLQAQGLHQSKPEQHPTINEGHEDSGIAMGFDDTDAGFGVEKFAGFLAEGVNVGSDPADVVVC